MEFVYLDEKLTTRAPNLLAPLFVKNTDQWAQLGDVVNALRRGESVSIRPANEAEKNLAEELVVMYEIGQELTVRRQMLYQQMMKYAEGVDPAVAAERLGTIEGAA